MVLHCSREIKSLLIRVFQMYEVGFVKILSSGLQINTVPLMIKLVPVSKAFVLDLKRESTDPIERECQL